MDLDAGKLVCPSTLRKVCAPRGKKRSRLQPGLFICLFHYCELRALRAGDAQPLQASSLARAPSGEKAVGLGVRLGGSRAKPGATLAWTGRTIPCKPAICCLTAVASLRMVRLNFFRRFFSPGGQMWQKAHAAPLRQPSSLWRNAQGLQRPSPWPADPALHTTSLTGSGLFSPGSSSQLAGRLLSSSVRGAQLPLLPEAIPAGGALQASAGDPPAGLRETCTGCCDTAGAVSFGAVRTLGEPHGDTGHDWARLSCKCSSSDGSRGAGKSMKVFFTTGAAARAAASAAAPGVAIAILAARKAWKSAAERSTAARALS